MNLRPLPVFILFLCIFIIVPVHADTFSLFDKFPVTQNGENGIWLQSRDSAGYTNLEYLKKNGNYWFGIPSAPKAKPVITRGVNPNLDQIPFDPEGIYAFPSAVNITGYDRDAVIRVTIPGSGGFVHLSGEACREGSGDVRFFVYKGEDQYSQPLWQVPNCGTVNLTIPYAEKDQVFFGVSAYSDDTNTKTRWKYLQLETPPGSGQQPGLAGQSQTIPDSSLTPAAASMFRASPEHTGVYDAGGMVPSNTQLWRFVTGTSVSSSSPTVSGGVVYIGSPDNALYAVDAVTGKEKWRFATGGAVSASSPAVSDGVVYIGCADSYLYAVDAVTGKEKWRFATGNYVWSSPAVANGVVYIGSDNYDLYAVDAVTGKEKWRFATTGRVRSSPAVANGVVYVGCEDKNLYAIDAVTGAEKWRFATGNIVYSSPAVVNGVIYVGSWDKNLYAVDALTGKEQWRFATENGISSSPAVANGLVYIGSNDNKLYAVDTVTGKNRWQFATKGDLYSSPAVTDSIVYIGSYDGNLYAVNAVSGTEKWRFATGADIRSSPAVSNGIVYVASYDIHLYAVGRVAPAPVIRLVTSATPGMQSTASSPTPSGSSNASLTASTPAPGVQSTPSSPSPSDTGNANPVLPVIVILGVVILAGGGYAFYRMKRKPAGDQIPVIPVLQVPLMKGPTGEPALPTPPPPDDWERRESESVLAKIALVEQEASGLMFFRNPVQALITQAREQNRSGAYDAARTMLITAEDAITSLVSCETRLMQWKEEGYATTPLELLRTDNPATITTAFKNFEQDLVRLRHLENRIQELKQSLSAENADPRVARRIADIESHLHDPKNIPSVEKEIEALEQQILHDQQERARQQDAEQLFSRLYEKAEKLTRYGSLTVSSFEEARNQITAGRYSDAQKTLKRVNDPLDALLTCETVLAGWKAKGYTIPELEGGFPRNTDAVLSLFRKSELDINRLEIIARDLEAKKNLYPDLVEQPETASIVSSLEQNLKNPSLADTAEKDYRQLTGIIRQDEDNRKILEQNLREQAEKVQRETRSPAIKEEITPVLKSIREHDLTTAREKLRDLAELQFSRANAALSTFPTGGAVAHFSSDPIREQIAAEHYGDAIINTENVIAEITRVQEERLKIIEQDLRKQVEKVQKETGSPAIKEGLIPVQKSIRERDFPGAKEKLRSLAEQQVSQAYTAHSTMPAEDAAHLSPDPIREQVAMEHYGDAIINAERVIAEITRVQEERLKIIEQNLRDDVEKVQKETSSPAIKEGLIPILRSIRERDFPGAKEMLRNLAEQQLSQANTVLSTVQTEGAVVTHSTDPIRKQIVEENYGEAIIGSEKTVAEIIRIREVFAQAEVLKSEVTEPAIISLFDNGKYEEFIHACSEWQEQRKAIIAFRERAASSLEKAGKFGRVPKALQEKLASEKIADIEHAIKDLDAFVASAQPALTLVLDHTRLVADKWHKVGVQITNSGDAHASGVSFSFSSEFETRWIKPTDIEAGKSTTVEIGILPKKEGNIPLEITVHCRYGQEKTYDITHEFWIDVVDRMTLTPQKDVAATPPQSPVSRFTPRPLTLKQLPPDLSDRYTESEFIGKGGFARVFKAKRKDGKFVAVKIPISMDASTGKSFIAEMQNWTKLNHPNIVKLYDFNIMPLPYFEMELCDSSLADRKKPIDSEEAAWILFNVCEGLKFTHANRIIHRDLKPQNILIKNGLPKISDWGLSRVISESTSTTTASFTPYYAAPEQISSEHKDERTDIWQLGVIFYELVTGHLPFTGDSMVAVMGAIASKNPALPSSVEPGSQPVESIIMKCLEKNHSKRYQSVLELQKDLALFLRVTYTESLTLSVTANDLQRSASYCGDLVLINMLTGDIPTAFKYLLDLAHYSKGDVKEEAQELAGQIRMRMDMGVTEIPEELIQKAENIVHRVSLGFRNRG